MVYLHDCIKLETQPTYSSLDFPIKLQNYRFKIIHREDHRMAHVDVLSRIVAFAETKLLEKELHYEQLQDSIFKDLSAKLEREDDHKFELLDGLIFRNG